MGWVWETTVFAGLVVGFATGLRSMTAMAVLCWFAYLGKLMVASSWAGWTARLWVAILFTVLAVGEYVADKLPQVPSRTAPGPLAARVVLGGLAGAIVATAMRASVLAGVLPGAIGAVAGAFAGHFVRSRRAKSGGADWPVAVAEDFVAVGIAVWALVSVIG